MQARRAEKSGQASSRLSFQTSLETFEIVQSNPLPPVQSFRCPRVAKGVSRPNLQLDFHRHDLEEEGNQSYAAMQHMGNCQSYLNDVRGFFD